MADCIDCKHAYPLKDNRGKYHSICICVESDAFLHPVSIVFDGCDRCEKRQGWRVMKRVTTDAPKDNIETALNLFYILEHETWVRGGGPGPEFRDVSLFDYSRMQIKAMLPDVDIPDDDNEFSCMMAEWLFDDADTPSYMIATLYTSAWAFAELRHRLMAYEDTGLTLEQIKNAQETLTNSSTQWISVKERLPDAEQEVRVLCKASWNSCYRYQCQAFYEPKGMLREKSNYGWDYECCSEYSEEDDDYFVNPGWYERIHNWDDYSAVGIADEVTHWMPLPEPPEDV